VEVFGQYAPYCANHYHSIPKPELHAKLVRLESSIETHKPADDQQVIRWITMIGSDGRKYRFMLQFNGSYFTRADEHCAQLHFLLDKCLRRGIMSSRKHLSFQPNTVVPIAQRLRIISDHRNNRSLKELFVNDCMQRNVDPSEPQRYFTRATSEAAVKEASLQKRQQTKQDVNLAAYNHVCETMVHPTMLQDQVFDTMRSVEAMYCFRRNYTSQLAVSSLMHYGMNTTESNPSQQVFNMQTGQAIPFDFRLHYNSQGLLEGNAIPFRMTRNMSTLIGPFMRDGIFVPSMTSGAEAVAKVKTDIRPFLCLVLRDDIVSWYCSKSPPRSDTKNQELERQLGDRILKNVSICQRRFLDCAPDDLQLAVVPIVSETENNKKLADATVRELLNTATSTAALSNASPSFQAWI
jgi:transformation/transcription domain-associated protein